MFLVLPGKQKPVTMYFVAVKQRFFKCHSRTVNLLKLSRCDSEGLVLDEITRGRTAIHSIFVISGVFVMLVCLGEVNFLYVDSSTGAEFQFSFSSA